MEKTQKRYINAILISLTAGLLIAGIFGLYNALVISQGKLTSEYLTNSFFSRQFLFVLIILPIAIFAGILAGKDRIFKYRFVIAAVVFIFCVILGVNGSSVGCFYASLGGEDTDLIFGVSRGIRGDEFGTFTPMTWSQYFDNNGKFSYFNTITRASATDVFIEYGLPVRSILMIYKPFLIGYLFLPMSNGLAFFWSGRFIALFMASFEFGRQILTKDNRKLSILYGILVSMSPVVQWWYAVNGLIEMLIFFQVSICLLKYFFETDSLKKKLVCAGGLVICAGGYILTLYPAWMIPLAYLLLGLIVLIFIENRKRINKRDIFIFACCAFVLAASMGLVYYRSHETIDIISQTEYPGKRLAVGGGVLYELFNYVSNIWYPVLDEAPFANVCEAGFVFSLSPLGYILYAMYYRKTGKHDKKLCIMIITSLIFVFYCVFGLPDFVLKLTLMDRTFTNRVLPIISFCDLLIFIRSISLCREAEVKVNKKICILLSVLLSCVLVWITAKKNPEYYLRYMLITEIIVMTVVFLASFMYVEKHNRFFYISLGLVGILAGLLANPVRLGVKSLEEHPTLKMVDKVVEANGDAVWIFESEPYPLTDILITRGARTINSTNVYPDLERWKKIDPEGRYKEVYNRYAHIILCYGQPPEGEEKFQLLYADYFKAYLDDSDLKKLGVNYLMTRNDLSYDDNFNLIDSTGGFSIYELKADN